MLWFVGLGISGFSSMPNQAMDVISHADITYLEQFTSPITESDVARIRDAAGGEFRLLKRWQVEDGKEILQSAKDGVAVLLSYGDPYIATTHIELRTRAMQEGIETGTIHASSSLTATVGQCGLHFYKIGGVATIMAQDRQLQTPYQAVRRNMTQGSHTMLLLEYDQDNDYFMDPRDALGRLLDAEEQKKNKAVSRDTFVIVASRIGMDGQAITAGKASSIIKSELGGPPHTLIIPGSLHFTEADALRLSARCLDEPADNSENSPKISRQMIERYVPMVRKQIREARPLYGSDHDAIFENAESYIRDAEEFLRDGQDEVAILSIGYADGLIDALRLAKGYGRSDA